MNLQGKKIGIYGLGKTGAASFQYFCSKSQVVCYDDSNAARIWFASTYGAKYIAPLDDSIWSTLDSIIASPGIALQYPSCHEIFKLATKYNIPIISDVEVLYHEMQNERQNVRFLGITGTNGKSTTTALLSHILSESGFAAGGNLGVPCLSMSKADGYVLELSSYQLDLLKDFKPKVAAITNITPDHLDRYPSMNEYIESKASIAKNMDQNDFLVINIDDRILNSLQYKFKDSKLIRISLELSSNADIYYDGDYDGKIVDLIKGQSHALKPPKSLCGKHNLYNILIAYAVSISLGVPSKYIIQKIENFPGIAHRLQFLGTHKYTNFYNDSKATNADATKQALGAISNIFWLAGGVPKEGGINSITPLFNKIKKAYFFGQARFEFLDIATEHGMSACVFENLADALANALDDAAKFNDNCNILLSPACASFDQFENFEDRGEVFTKLVHKIINP